MLAVDRPFGRWEIGGVGNWEIGGQLDDILFGPSNSAAAFDYSCTEIV